MLWQPEKETHEKFPVQFQEVVRTMLRGIRDERSALSALHPDVLMYIFNKHVGWEWFGKDVPAWKSRFPALATSCRSRSVDLIIDVIIVNGVVSIIRHVYRNTKDVTHTKYSINSKISNQRCRI